MAAVGKAGLQEPVNAPGCLFPFPCFQERIAGISRAPGALGKVPGIVPAAVHRLHFLPIETQNILMAHAMDALDRIAAALMAIEIDRRLQRPLPHLFTNGKRLGFSISIPEPISSRLPETAEIQECIRVPFVGQQHRPPRMDSPPPLVQQLEGFCLPGGCQGHFLIARPIANVREGDLPGRDVPAFIVVRFHLLKFQGVKVDGHVLFPDFPVVACAGLAEFKPEDAVPREIVDLPQDLHPSALGDVRIGLPRMGECAVRAGSINQIQRETHVRIPGRVDVHPEGKPVPGAPVLRLVKLQRHAGQAPLVAVETVPGRPVGRIQDVGAVHEGNGLAKRLLPVDTAVAGIFQLGIAIPHHPSAPALHIIDQAGSQDRLFRPTVQHRVTLLLPCTGKQAEPEQKQDVQSPHRQ